MPDNTSPFKTANPNDRLIPPTFDKKGNALYKSITSPSDDTYAIALMVPDRIVPVIFVPGVMGSNLGVKQGRNKPPTKAVWLLKELFFNRLSTERGLKTKITSKAFLIMGQVIWLLCVITFEILIAEPFNPSSSSCRCSSPQK